MTVSKVRGGKTHALLSAVAGVVVAALLLSGLMPTAAQSTPAATEAAGGASVVKLGGNDELGAFLVGPNGMTLYLYTKDTPGVSNCYDKCATAWPPLLVDNENVKLVADQGIPGKLGLTKRTDGKFQVTYNYWPLYYWQKDTKVGESTGQNVGKVWFVIKPEAVLSHHDDKLGDILVGANGMTLYLYTKDTPDTSNCYDQCATNWPPLLVEEKDKAVMGGIGVPGKLATTKRTDGKLQVTYNGWPLYYWIKDQKPGDTTGQNVGKVWFVINPESVQVGENEKLGKFLIAANGMTLYIYTKDTENTSNCYDKCATAWPPLLVAEGQKPTGTKDVTGKLDVTKRTDGTFQVTYNGQPLYYWQKDVNPGDTTGQDVGKVWFVLKP